MHCTKISAEFEVGGHTPGGAHPQNVAFGYDVGKIREGCLVNSCKHDTSKTNLWSCGKFSADTWYIVPWKY